MVQYLLQYIHLVDLFHDVFKHFIILVVKYAERPYGHPLVEFPLFKKFTSYVPVRPYGLNKFDLSSPNFGPANLEAGGTSRPEGHPSR